MSAPALPPLAAWQDTRDALHGAARVLGAFRGGISKPVKHWWHVTLATTARGLTTTPVSLAGATTAPEVLEVELDLVAHAMRLTSSEGWESSVPLAGQAPRALGNALVETLGAHGLAVPDSTFLKITDETVHAYDPQHAASFRRVLLWMDARLKAFKAGLRAETSPVHLFPHHFDLAVNWFSGRLVPGKDPADAGAADEQMNFGFVTGDAAIGEAYLYATAYPEPAGWTELALPAGARWQTEGWTGAVLPYAALAAAAEADVLLEDFLRGVQAHGARRMGAAREASA
ncbi:MAG: DUF5996 family protein [Planctomycetota bacterium]|nr:DUF5996 family protein [Planctomycetota bacterium]